MCIGPESKSRAASVEGGGGKQRRYSRLLDFIALPWPAKDDRVNALSLSLAVRADKMRKRRVMRHKSAPSTPAPIFIDP